MVSDPILVRTATCATCWTGPRGSAHGAGGAARCRPGGYRSPRRATYRGCANCALTLPDVRLENPPSEPRLVREILGHAGVTGRIGLIGAQALEHGVYAELVAADDHWTVEAADELLQASDSARTRTRWRACDARRPSATRCLPSWRMRSARRICRRRLRQRVVAAVIMTYACDFGHTLRTLCIGEPSDDHVRAWRAVAEAQSEAAARLMPGENARLVPLAAEDVLFQHFPEGREGDRLRFQSTHFIGLDDAEYPTALTSRAAEPRSHVCRYPTVERLCARSRHDHRDPPEHLPAQHRPRRCGRYLRVTPTGAERLTTYPLDLQVIDPR